jgi:hypothetical protein
VSSSISITSDPATEPVAGEPPLATRRRPSPRRVLAIASLGAAVAFVDATIVNIAFPNIARSFSGTPISSLSWVLNAYNIVFAAFLVAAGRIADILGRRRIFVLGFCRRLERRCWCPPHWVWSCTHSPLTAERTGWHCCRPSQRWRPVWGHRWADCSWLPMTGDWCSW